MVLLLLGISSKEAHVCLVRSSTAAVCSTAACGKRLWLRHLRFFSQYTRQGALRLYVMAEGSSEPMPIHCGWYSQAIMGWCDQGAGVLLRTVIGVILPFPSET